MNMKDNNALCANGDTVSNDGMEADQVASGKSNLWNDATIIGDLENPETRAVLNSKLVLMFGDYETAGNRWMRIDGSVKGILEHKLTHHPEVVEKDGEGIVFGTSKLATRVRTRDGVTITQHTHRAKNKMKSVTAIAIDVDGTAKINAVRDRLVELGWCAVLYTTHSHAAKKTQIGDRFRIIIFLKTPHPLPMSDDTMDEASQIAERSAVIDDYERRYAGVVMELGLTEVDDAGLSPNQMMYTPRRPSKDAEFEHYFIAGAALHLEDVPLGDVNKLKLTGKEKSKVVRKPNSNGNSRKSARQGDAVGFEEHLALIGDGPGLRGFDAPIYSAALSYFGSGEDDEDALIETLRDAILAAPCKDGRNKSRYAQDDYLVNRVEQAREYIEAQDTPVPHDPEQFEDPEDWLPYGYKIKRDTIYKQGGEDEPDVPVCQRFDVVGRASSLDGTDGAGRIISFETINGVTIEMTLDRADLFKDTGGDVIERLAASEMTFHGAGKRWREDLLNLFRCLNTSRQIPTVTRPGWQRDRAGDIIGFMCPTGQYIDADRDGPVMRLHTAAMAKDREAGGTLEGWQEAANAAQRYPSTNFYWMFGMSAGFVGPLLGIIGGEPCGFNFSGETSKGKTIAQRLMSSVWASPAPKKGTFFTMNATTNAVEDLASIGSETALALDEIGNMARPADLMSMLFGMSSGAGKSRKAGRDAGLSAGAEYLPFVSLSNERSLRATIEKAVGKGAYKAGLSARFPDIDVTSGRKRDSDVIDTLGGVKANFGHAGPAFVQYLIESGWIDKKDKLAAKVAKAANEIAGEDAPAAKKRAAAVFALVQVAGELACDAGLLTSKKAVAISVQAAFKRFKDSDEGRATDAAQSLIDGFRSFFNRAQGREIVPAGDLGGQHYGNIIGWYTDDLIILDATAVADIEKLGLSGKLDGLLAALNKFGALIKSGRNNSHNSLPNDVKADASDTRERKVKNYRIRRDVLEV